MLVFTIVQGRDVKEGEVVELRLFSCVPSRLEEGGVEGNPEAPVVDFVGVGVAEKRVEVKDL